MPSINWLTVIVSVMTSAIVVNLLLSFYLHKLKESNKKHMENMTDMVVQSVKDYLGK